MGFGGEGVERRVSRGGKKKRKKEGGDSVDESGLGRDDKHRERRSAIGWVEGLRVDSGISASPPPPFFSPHPALPL